MINRYDFSPVLKRFTKKIRNTWQMFFLPAALLYICALLHAFYVKPQPTAELIPYLANIDLVSYAIAIILTVVIFNLKRRFFSRRFSRQIIEQSFKAAPEADSETLLEDVFTVLQKKLPLVWGLGLLLVVEGVLFYIITALPGNMHIYFIIGIFSLFINYPRKEMFEDIALYVVEEKKLQSQ